MRIIPAIEQFKVIRVFKVNPEDWEVSVDVKVQINQVGEIIQEAISRIQIEEIKQQQEKFEDPAVW